MYYSLVKLKKNCEIFIGSDLLKVDVTRVDDKNVVSNDVDFMKGIEEGYYNWVSGGGTYLINNQYLVVVKRPLKSAVNPGKYSLFTGRSDSHDERVNPRGLVRELFEELVLYSGKKLLAPKCKEYQDIIDSCYRNFARLGKFVTRENIGLELDEVSLGDRTIEITTGHERKKIKLAWHVNRFNDINVLFLFKVNIDIRGVTARDAEYHIEEDQSVFHNRDIFLLDINSNQLIGLCKNSKPGEELYLEASKDASEHLEYMLNIVKDKVI